MLKTRQGAFVALLCASLSVPALAPANETQAEIDALKSRLSSLEKTQKDSLSSHTDKVSVSGFMTYGLSRHNVHQEAQDGSPVYYNNRTTDEVSHTELTRAGIQFNAKVADKTQVVAQLLSRGRNDYDTQVQWAYIEQSLAPTLRVRGGRFVMPFYMHSQYSNVGFAYHWADLPGEVYSLVPFDAVNGVDLTWDFSTGPISHRLNAYTAAVDLEHDGFADSVTFEVKEMVGMNLSSTLGDLNTWLGYSHSKTDLDLSPLAGPVAQSLMIPEAMALTLTEPANLEDASSYITSAGFQYDNGKLLLMGERTQLGVGDWFATRWGGYLSAGYRIGRFMPHYTWGVTNSHSADDPERYGPLGQMLNDSTLARSKSHTFGIRYDVNHSLAVKFEAQRFYDFNSDKIRTNGIFTEAVAPFGLPEGIERDHPTVYRLTIDTVF